MLFLFYFVFFLYSIPFCYMTNAIEIHNFFKLLKLLNLERFIKVFKFFKIIFEIIRILILMEKMLNLKLKIQ